MTAAKGFGGGLPIAAVTGRAELMDSVAPGGLGGTYRGNPVACEAALGAFEEIEQHDLRARARAIDHIMRPALRELQRSCDAVGDVRGRGATLAIELVESGDDRGPASELTGRIARRCHEQGLLVLTAGSFGNVLRFLPPLSISDALLVEGLDVLREVITQEAGHLTR